MSDFSAVIFMLNGFAERWAHAMGAVLWQSTLLIIAASAIAWCLRRSSPTVRFWLWQIVAVKLLLMPFWSFYVPLPSWAEPAKRLVFVQWIEKAQDKLDEPAMATKSQTVDKKIPSAPLPPPSAPQSPSTVAWQAWMLAIWCLAVASQLLRLGIQHRRLDRLLRRGVLTTGNLADLTAELAGEIGLRNVPAAVTVLDDCPLFVCGLWRPKIILPDRLITSLGPAERRQVILHELAHIKRRDLLWGWPVEIAKIVYFFHPLVYWVAYQLRFERELACDQLAMAQSGHQPADYAHTLVQVVSRASAPAAAQAAAIAAGLTGGENQKLSYQSNEYPYKKPPRPLRPLR